MSYWIKEYNNNLIFYSLILSLLGLTHILKVHCVSFIVCDFRPRCVWTSITLISYSISVMKLKNLAINLVSSLSGAIVL